LRESTKKDRLTVPKSDSSIRIFGGQNVSSGIDLADGFGGNITDGIAGGKGRIGTPGRAGHGRFEVSADI
jgi:hypothetical protein